MSKALQTVIENIISSMEEKGYGVNKVKIEDDLVTMWFETPFDMTGEFSFDPKILGVI